MASGFRESRPNHQRDSRYDNSSARLFAAAAPPSTGGPNCCSHSTHSHSVSSAPRCHARRPGPSLSRPSIV
ncbi:hypothetical protein P153DRAFT_371263 [Dothidotthia symphoricarpi CBS 119687]|uniref:Uncharacterized protein n=1 Tax=Dothidotthia symphoricarpi CBS 119687 TaxID=1392245 RepID=A0A6A5ZYW8_9PLEO|nr:uncharacterized protein P153DRAFT_371263 [Dothidotthia symphoricarpi CBS 119687]KAF2123957.1 hypothetical protein P153DRAFT_371263 [Dothidotthia symphoricarpi CBS 119687]